MSYVFSSSLPFMFHSSSLLVCVAPGRAEHVLISFVPLSNVLFLLSAAPQPTRAGNEPSRRFRFHNHGEGPSGLHLASGPYYSAFTFYTPPEGWVRAKKKYITFNTNFGRYLPRGTIIDGSLKCRIRAFCTIAKISGEMPKKGLKTGQNGVKFFLTLTHVEY